MRSYACDIQAFIITKITFFIHYTKYYETRKAFCGTWHLPRSKSTTTELLIPIIYNNGYVAYFPLRMREMAIFTLPV